MDHAPGNHPQGSPAAKEHAEALRLWVVLARSYQSFTRVVSQDLARHGLTPPQFGVLEALYHLGPMNLGELAEKLLVTGGNITYVMDRLERDGLVARVRSERDRRVVRAELTPEGTALLDRIFPEHARMIADAVSCLSGEEQRELADRLKRLGLTIQNRLAEDGSPSP